MSITVDMIPKEAQNVIKKLEEAGCQAWCVGGCVRDALLGRKPKDWDVTTSALPEQVMELFGRRAIPRGLKHGTVWVRSGVDGVDVTTFRIDGDYEDRRRPSSVAFTDNLDEDLWRRDLTVNAMAFNMAGELRDPFGGREDLERRVLRCVGEPDRRFREDALRMMRILRFSAVLGFDIDPEAEEAVHRNRELLREIAIERVELEMLSLLAGQDAAEILRRFPDVIAVFWPEIQEMIGFEQHNVHHCYDVWEHTLHALDAAEQLEIPRPVQRPGMVPPNGKPPGGKVPGGKTPGGKAPGGKGGNKATRPVPWDRTEERTVLCTAALLHDIGKPRCLRLDENGGGHFIGHWTVGRNMADEMLARLRTPRLFRERVVRLVEQHERHIPKTEKEVRRLLGLFGEADLRLLLILKRADNLAQSPAYRERQKELDQAEQILDHLLRQGACFTLKQMALNGRDLISMGLKGPDIGAVLERLLSCVMDGKLPNERRPLLKAASKLAKAYREGTDPDAVQYLPPQTGAGNGAAGGGTLRPSPKKKRKRRRKRKKKAVQNGPEQAAEQTPRQLEENQTEETRTEENQTEENQTEETRTEENQTEENQTEETRTEILP